MMYIPITLKQTLLAISSAMLLAACATTSDPWTGEERSTRTGQGAAIGAGVGALSGAAIGNYMDRQERALREQLRGTGVSVTRRGNDIILNMPGNITFGFDRSDLMPEFHDVLDSVALVLGEFDQTVLVIDGHTDSIGRREYNMDLSRRRAESVGRYLITQGVVPVRVATYGYGPDHPIASNDSEAGRAANRRVELTLMPVTE